MQIPSLLCAGNQQDRESPGLRGSQASWAQTMPSHREIPRGAEQGSRAVMKTRLDPPDPPSLLESSPSTPGIPKGT